MSVAVYDLIPDGPSSEAWEELSTSDGLESTTTTTTTATADAGAATEDSETYWQAAALAQHGPPEGPPGGAPAPAKLTVCVPGITAPQPELPRRQ